MTANKIKAVLVGCGGIASVWVDAINEFDDIQIAGVVDTNPDSAEKISEKSKGLPNML